MAIRLRGSPRPSASSRLGWRQLVLALGFVIVHHHVRVHHAALRQHLGNIHALTHAQKHRCIHTFTHNAQTHGYTRTRTRTRSLAVGFIRCGGGGRRRFNGLRMCVARVANGYCNGSVPDIPWRRARDSVPDGNLCRSRAGM